MLSELKFILLFTSEFHSGSLSVNNSFRYSRLAASLLYFINAIFPCTCFSVRFSLSKSFLKYMYQQLFSTLYHLGQSFDKNHLYWEQILSTFKFNRGLIVIRLRLMVIVWSALFLLDQKLYFPPTIQGYLNIVVVDIPPSVLILNFSVLFSIWFLYPEYSSYADVSSSIKRTN